MNAVKFFECFLCVRRFTVTKDGPLELTNSGWPMQFCEICELRFCARCFPAHDCPGHDPEVVYCMWCDCEIRIDKNNSPALIDGDPFCARCAFQKPWEKK